MSALISLVVISYFVFLSVNRSFVNSAVAKELAFVMYALFTVRFISLSVKELSALKAIRQRHDDSLSEIPKRQQAEASLKMNKFLSPVLNASPLFESHLTTFSNTSLCVALGATC